MKKIFWLLPLAVLLTSCTSDGYPSTDTEVIVVASLIALVVICVTVVLIYMIKHE